MYRVPKCPFCGHPLRLKNNHCANCCYPIEDQFEKHRKLYIGLLIASIIFVLSIVIYFELFDPVLGRLHN
ncbi:MAG: hypothetical protein QM644_06320 [Mobilitalea sp.]